jgi:hypothetical protein
MMFVTCFEMLLHFTPSHMTKTITTIMALDMAEVQQMSRADISLTRTLILCYSLFLENNFSAA